MEVARSQRADLIDPATLASLGRIEIVARWIVDGFLAGLHRSPRKGFSVEFADYRPYQAGDDLRFVDWKIAARSDRWVVRQYEEETNLRATIVLDVSRSMAWSGAQLRPVGDAVPPGRLTKLAYAEILTASLALGHDVTVLHIMDPAERWLGGTGEALFVDPETDLEVPASISDVRSAYRS